MAYDLDQFISDCRSALSRDPGPAGREQVRQNLERLLANKDFVEGFAAKFRPLLMSQEVKLMQAAPWGPHP